MSNGRAFGLRHMGTPALQVRNRTRLVWAALPFLLTQASAYEAGPSSLSVLEARLVKLKKESAELHEHGSGLKEVKRLKSQVKPLKSPSNPGAVNAGTESNIAQVRSLEARLSTENQRLRQQLQRSPKTEVSLLTSTGAQGDQSFALLVRLLLLFVVVNSVLYLLWNMEGPTVEKVKRRAAEPLMRAMGRGTYEVEISELQVTNLSLTGSLVLGLELCGRLQWAAEASCVQGLVRFQDRFRFQIQGGGSEGQSCVLRVAQAEETIAEVALSTKDIMRRVHSKHGQQYFHYRMFPKEAYASWRPSLSLRMREVETAPPNQSLR